MSRETLSRIPFGWRVVGNLFPNRPLLIGIFVDEFLYRTKDGHWVFGEALSQNESRVWMLTITHVADSSFNIIHGQRVEGYLQEIRAHLESIGKCDSTVEAISPENL